MPRTKWTRKSAKPAEPVTKENKNKYARGMRQLLAITGAAEEELTDQQRECRHAIHIFLDEQHTKGNIKLVEETED